jgi:hypothetical protein
LHKIIRNAVITYCKDTMSDKCAGDEHAKNQINTDGNNSFTKI